MDTELDLARDLSEADAARRDSADALDLSRNLEPLEVVKMLRKEGDEWVLRSKDSKRVLRRWKSKPSDAEVRKREREIEFFKHRK